MMELIPGEPPPIAPIPPNERRKPLLLVFLAGLAVTLSAEAQPAPQEKRGQKDVDGYSLRYDRALSWEEKGERMFLFSGSVELARTGMSLRADRLIVWAKLDDPEFKLREAYLEGNVVSRRPDARTGRDMTIRAERLYYDFRNHRAFVVELEGRTYTERLRSPVVLRAREARESGLGKWSAKDVVVTTCTYGVPHYHVHLDRASFRGLEPRERADPYDIWPFQDWAIRGESISAEIYGLSVFFWPVLAFGSAVSEAPIEAIRGGSTTRFGFWVETDWGFKVPKGWVDAINPFDDSGSGDDERNWGAVEWEIDWRRKRGWAGGLDLKWKWDDYHGYVDTYYLHDLGGDPDIPFDAQFLPLKHPDRGRVRMFHRHEVAPGWRFEFETSYLSDRNLLQEFFPLEYKEGKEQESVAYVRWLGDGMGGYVLERNRLNDFQTQNEYLPRARYFLYDLPVALGLSYTLRTDAAHIRERFDEELDLPFEETYRLDIVNELSRPVDLAVATAAPFVRARNTMYDGDLSGDRVDRFLGTAGVKLTTQLTGVQDFTWEGAGMHGLRHIALLESAWGGNLVNTVEPSQLFPFDETDQLDKFQELSLEMRHRFQTKVKTDKGPVTHEFLNLGAAIEYYPHSNRDASSIRVDNYEPPFHWISLAPHDSTGVIGPRLWSNLHWDLKAQPRDYFAVTAAGEYNPVWHQEEARQYSVSIQPTETFTATVGEVFVKDITTAFAVGVNWQITEKWRTEATGQYDFELGQFLNWRAVLTRDFHDFYVEVVAEVDETRDERKFYVTAFPKFVRRSKK